MKLLRVVRGLIRPFIAVSFVIVTLYLAIVGKLNAREILTITGIIAAFYFGERAALKNPNTQPGQEPEPEEEAEPTAEKKP